MQKNKLRKKEISETDFISCLKRCLVFIPVFCIIGVICTTVIAFIFYNSDDPTSSSELCANISLYTSFVLSTVLFLKGINEKRILICFIYGSSIFLFLYALSLIFGNGFGSINDFILRILIPVIGAFIGFISLKFSSGNKKRRKRHV